MTNSEAWAVLAGILLPLLVSLIKQAEWPSKAKVILAIVLSLGAGLATTYFGGRIVLTWEFALIDAAIVFSEATVLYKLWFEGTALENRLAKVGSDIL